ncbi:MAG: hypothetical protein NZ576_00860 [Bacteroidia bacterium]|nr:hypothetical protein [Bacteroidia bacterium]
MGFFELFWGKSKRKPSRDQTLVVFDWESVRGKQLNYEFIKKLEKPIVWVVTRQEAPERYQELAAYPTVTKIVPPYEKSLRLYLVSSLVYEVTTNAIYKKIILVGEGSHYAGTIRFLKEKGLLVDLINAEELLPLKPAQRNDIRWHNVEEKEKKSSETKPLKKVERKEESKFAEESSISSKVREYALSSGDLTRAESKGGKKQEERRGEEIAAKNENKEARTTERSLRKESNEAKETREVKKVFSSAEVVVQENLQSAVRSTENKEPTSSKLSVSKPREEGGTSKVEGQKLKGNKGNVGGEKSTKVEEVTGEKKMLEASRAVASSSASEVGVKGEKSSLVSEAKPSAIMRERKAEGFTEKNEISKEPTKTENSLAEKKGDKDTTKKVKLDVKIERGEKSERSKAALSATTNGQKGSEKPNLLGIDDAKLIVDYFHNNFIIDETYNKSFLGMVVKQATGKNVYDVFGTKHAKNFINQLIAKDCIAKVDSQHYLIKAYPTIDTILQIGQTLAEARHSSSHSN